MKRVSKIVAVSAPSLNLRVKVVLYEPEIVDVPDYAYERTEDGGEVEVYVGDRRVVRASARIDFEYEPWLFGYIERHIISRIRDIDRAYERFGAVINWGGGFAGSGEYERISVEISPWHYVSIDTVLSTVSETFPGLVTSSVLEGVREICAEFGCENEVVAEEIKREVQPSNPKGVSRRIT